MADSVPPPEDTNDAQAKHTREAVRRSLQLLKMDCKERRDKVAQIPYDPQDANWKKFFDAQRALTAQRVMTCGDLLGNMIDGEWPNCLPLLFPGEAPPRKIVINHTMHTGFVNPVQNSHVNFSAPVSMASWTLQGSMTDSSIEFGVNEFDVKQLINTLLGAYSSEINNPNNQHQDHRNWKKIFRDSHIIEILTKARDEAITTGGNTTYPKKLSSNMSDYALQRDEETGDSTEFKNTWSYVAILGSNQRYIVTISLVCPAYSASSLTVNKKTHQMYNSKIAPHAGATWVKVVIRDSSQEVRHVLHVTPFLFQRTAHIYPFYGTVISGSSVDNYEWSILKMPQLFVDIPMHSSSSKAPPNARFAEVDVMQLGLQNAYNLITMTNKDARAAYEQLQAAVQQARGATAQNKQAQEELLKDFKVYYSTEEPSRGGVWVVWFIILKDHIAGVQIRYPRGRVGYSAPPARLPPRRRDSQFRPHRTGRYGQRGPPGVPVYIPMLPHVHNYHTYGLPTYVPPMNVPPQHYAQAQADTSSRVRFQLEDDADPPERVPRHASRLAPPTMAPWSGPAVDLHSLARSIEEIKRSLNDTHLLKAALTA